MSYFRHDADVCIKSFIEVSRSCSQIQNQILEAHEGTSLVLLNLQPFHVHACLIRVVLEKSAFDKSAAFVKRT